MKGKITILFGHHVTRIELADAVNYKRIVDIELNQSQTCQAIEGLGYTNCKFKIHDISNLRKKSKTKENGKR